MRLKRSTTPLVAGSYGWECVTITAGTCFAAYIFHVESYPLKSGQLSHLTLVGLPTVLQKRDKQSPFSDFSLIGKLVPQFVYWSIPVKI